MFRNPVVIGGGTPFLPPVAEDIPLDLIETRTFGSRVIYERYRRVRASDGGGGTGLGWACRPVMPNPARPALTNPSSRVHP